MAANSASINFHSRRVACSEGKREGKGSGGSAEERRMKAGEKEDPDAVETDVPATVPANGAFRSRSRDFIASSPPSTLALVRLTSYRLFTFFLANRIFESRY